jgi:predicted O-methyltransferase YrrM
MRSATHSVGTCIANPANVMYIPDWIRSMRSAESPLSSGVPWLSYLAIGALREYLHPDAHVFEFGGGGSTLWFARRTQSVTTVEHDPIWAERVQQELRHASLSNCTLLLRECRSETGFQGYVAAIDQFPDSHFDVILIDGRMRSVCLPRAFVKVRPGGLVMLDDSDRDCYRSAIDRLPSWSRREIRGIRRSTLRPAQTTIWIRPESRLDSVPGDGR